MVSLNGQRITIMWVNGFKITEKAKAIISTKIHDT